MARRNPYEVDSGDPTGLDGSRIPNSSLANTPVGWNRNAPPSQMPDLNSVTTPRPTTQPQPAKPSVPMMNESGAGVNPAWREQRNQMSMVANSKAASDALSAFTNPQTPTLQDPRTGVSRPMYKDELWRQHAKGLEALGIRDINQDASGNFVVDHADNTRTVMSPQDMTAMSMARQADYQRALNPDAYAEQQRIQHTAQTTAARIAEYAPQRQAEAEAAAQAANAKAQELLQTKKNNNYIAGLQSLLNNHASNADAVDPNAKESYERYGKELRDEWARAQNELNTTGTVTIKPLTTYDKRVEFENAVRKTLGMAMLKTPEVAPTFWSKAKQYARDRKTKLFTPEPVDAGEISATDEMTQYVPLTDEERRIAQSSAIPKRAVETSQAIPVTVPQPASQTAQQPAIAPPPAEKPIVVEPVRPRATITKGGKTYDPDGNRVIKDFTERNALKPGTIYIGPDGKKRRKS